MFDVPPSSRYSTPILLAGGATLLTAVFWAGFSIRDRMDYAPSFDHPAAASANPSTAPTSKTPGNAHATPVPEVSVASAAPDALDWTTRHLTQADTGLLSKTHITPELARTLLAKVKAENKDINERALLCACILNALSHSGHVDEAWRLIEESRGTVRVMEIGMLFQTEKLSLDTLLAKLGELTDPDDRTNAVRGILMSRPGEIANLDFSKIPIETAEQKHAAFGAMVMALQKSAKDKEPEMSEAIMGKVIELARSGKIEPKHLNLALDSDFGMDPFRKWEILEGMKEGFTPADVERFRAQSVPNMIHADLDKAMKLLCTDPQSKYSVPILNRAVSTMYQADPEQANAWITSNLATIDPATGQRVIFSVGQAAIRSGEIATARQWADRLVNPGVKQQLLGQIETAETSRKTLPR